MCKYTSKLVIFAQNPKKDRIVTYLESIDYLYSQAPMFQNVGKRAYKTGLETTLALDAHYGHAHQAYTTIHVAGTNGKGSTSHMIASVLQCAGYKVGLYTSPHLKDFRERIRVNGEMIPEAEVVSFVEDAKPLIAELNPSFFEITTAMAFLYFEKAEVDVAVIEVGLGGRLDCTNIISPEVSVITNISIDHTDLLGESLKEIAIEKAGVIKERTPVVVGEWQEVACDVFKARAEQLNAPLFFADLLQRDKNVPPCGLKGMYQLKNRAAALTALQVLRRLGWRMSDSDICEGFLRVQELTGIQGRWQTLSTNPRVVCDTGHNEAGIAFITSQLAQEEYEQLHIVLGMVGDKKIEHMLSQLPKDAIYYFTNAQIPRALPSRELKEMAAVYGLHGESYDSVSEALGSAKVDDTAAELVLVGGSNLTVSDVI